MRLLVYGGTFNPPHPGHVHALSCAAEELKPDRVMVIPDNIPPHKALAEGSPTPEQRLRLCEIAFSEIPDTEISPMELHREGKSYTSDTLRELSDKYPDAEIFFLVGTDMFLSMEEWHDYRSIFSLCTLAVLPREKGEKDDLERQAEHLHRAYGARSVIIKKKPLPMDSTSLRSALAKRDGADMLGAAVYAEIIRLRLYDAKPNLAWLRAQTDECLKPSRIPHVRGVEETASKLAECWGENAGDAAEAGILHDITKKLSETEQLRLIEKYGIVLDDAERAEPKILHARTGAWYARERFGVPDRIFSAIEWHTTGCPGMTTLDKIVYLADFIEPTRNFPGVDDVRTLAFENLDDAMIRALTMSLSEVISRGGAPHPRTMETLRWLQNRN